MSDDVTDHVSTGHVTNTKTLVGLRETLCYKVTTVSEGKLSNRLYVVEYLALEQHFPIKTSHNFSIPIVAVQCTCACPGESKERCAAHTCAPNSTCIVVRETGQTPEGCLWLGAETVSCCVFSLSPGLSGAIIQLSSFETRLKLSVSVLDLDTRQVLREENVVTVDAMSGAILTLDDHLKLKVKLEGGDRALLQEGRYVKIKGDLYHIDPGQVNMLNDWDFNKLGWFKEDGAGRMVFREADLRRAVTIRTVNCGRNIFKVDMSGDYFSTPEMEFRLRDRVVELGEYLASHVGGLEIGERMVSVRARNSRRVAVEWIGFNTTFSDEVWLYDESRLGNFTAVIRRDEYGNNKLSCEMRGAAGQIVGFIRGGRNGTQEEDVTMIVPGGEQELYITRQPVITVCTESTRVCLKAAQHRQYQCRQPVCQRDSERRELTAPQSHNLYHVTLLETGYLRLSTWYRHGNPGNWFDNEYHVGESVMVVLYLVVGFILCRMGLKLNRWALVTRRRRRGAARCQVKEKSSSSETSGEFLEKFTHFKNVGYASKSLEDYLNERDMFEDWSSPYQGRRHSSL